MASVDFAETGFLFDKFKASSGVFDPLARLPALPDVAFGAFNEDTAEEIDEIGSLLHSIESAGDRYHMVSLVRRPASGRSRPTRLKVAAP